MADAFASHGVGLDSPAPRAFDAYAAKSDGVDLSNATRALYTGSGGDIKVTTVAGDTVTFKSVPAGSILPVRVARLWSTGTTVTDCIGLY